MNVKPTWKLNRKARREFDRLSPEEKAKIIKDIIDSEISSKSGTIVMNAFIDGTRYECQHLYQKYVQKIDQAEDEERDEKIESLLSDIRKGHLLYEKSHPKESGTDTTRVETKKSHWIDNADSYKCAVCGFETDNPNKLKLGPKICPLCFCEMEY